MNYYSKILIEHYNTGEPMDRFFHLLYYNFCSSKADFTRELKLFQDNIKIFCPYYRRFKKLRYKNNYGVEVNIALVNQLISLINQYRYKKTCYRSQRKYFKNNRNRLFKILFTKQKTCKICGTTDRLTVDHIHPLIKGGSNELFNLQILCSSCNSRKGAKV